MEVSDTELTFCHNGRGFRSNEITHLIYYGSTKLEGDDTLGQFGSGFLTTHLLSPTIHVSGHLTEGQTFEFQIDRGGDSVADLKDRMDASFEEFVSSLTPRGNGRLPKTSTEFRYPIDERASEAVRKGVTALEQSGPLVAVVNQEFQRIEVRTPNSGTTIELTERRDLAACIREVEVTVTTSDGAAPKRQGFIAAESDGVSVVVPIKRQDLSVVLVPPTNAPKLLLGFPLIGTEDFSFPAVVHSLRFSPTEDRDGVYLGQSDDPVNSENQAVLEEACRLLLSIAEFAAKERWSDGHLLADLPPVRARRWLNDDWLRNSLKAKLVDPIRATPVVLTESGGAVAPTASTLPMGKTLEAVHKLWSLAQPVKDLTDTLPTRVAAPGWCGAAQSWATLYGRSVSELKETMNGHDLAVRVEAAGSVEKLQHQLKDRSAVSWLDELHDFLSANGFSDALRSLSIIPDQDGQFRTLQRLHRDVDIPPELKEIASLVGWNLRAELRHPHLSTLDDEPGAGDLDCKSVIHELIDRLRERMDKALDEDSRNASVQLFGYLAREGQWDHLAGFPVPSDDGVSSTPIRLRLHDEDDPERPLAPVRVWPETLQRYSGLFPKGRILADNFAKELDDHSVWSELDERGFLRTSVLYRTRVLYTRKEEFGFLPDEPLSGEVDHEVDQDVEVTQIAFLVATDVGVLPRVRKSRKQARLFWDFLVGWLAVEDAQGLQAQQSNCACGSSHRYYPAIWLVPVKHNKWVPLPKGSTDQANAYSLAQLVRDSDWHPQDLQDSPHVIAILRALGVGGSDFLRTLFAEDEEERETLDGTLARLLTSVNGDGDRLQTLADEIQEDKGLFDHLDERRTRRRMVHENQRLGGLVEDLVKENLEEKGFEVRRTGVGSDFAIRPDPVTEGESIGLELVREGRTWLVEIKSARDDSVRMTAVQARTAVQHDSDYLLCVVPISAGSEDLGVDAVRRQMRFIQGIGRRLAAICADLDEIEDLRDIATAEDAAGFQLELDTGSPRIRIRCAVWKTGFGIESLLSRLTATTR